VLHHLLDHAITLGWIASNPVKLTRRFKIKGEGFHTWTEDEVAQYIERHPPGTKAHLALMLMLYTGQRRSDIIRLGWQHVRPGDKIAVRQKKTDTLLLPIAPELADALEGVPRTNLTFLLTSFGAPFSFNGFGNWMRIRCNEAGLPDCAAHGLRKLAATRMANAECTDEQLMAVFGWRSHSEVRRYTRAADQGKLAEQAFAKVGGRMKSEQKLSNLGTRLDKTAAK
jgi:integrase